MTRKGRLKKNNSLPRILIVVGVMALAAVVLMLKIFDDNQAQTTATLPAEQLQSALADSRPTLAFFHSNSCSQCIEMTKIVEQVHPEFSASVVLVDVNIYDERNESLLQQVGLQFIPTLIFYDRSGREEVSVGVMEAEQLRQTLAVLAAGE